MRNKLYKSAAQLVYRHIDGNWYQVCFFHFVHRKKKKRKRSCEIENFCSKLIFAKKACWCDVSIARSSSRCVGFQSYLVYISCLQIITRLKATESLPTKWATEVTAVVLRYKS